MLWLELTPSEGDSKVLVNMDTTLGAARHDEHTTRIYVVANPFVEYWKVKETPEQIMHMIQQALRPRAVDPTY